MYAIDNGHRPIVQLLIQSGSDVNRQDANEMTPLMVAPSENQIDIVRDLLSGGADVNFKSTDPRPDNLR